MPYMADLREERHQSPGHRWQDSGFIRSSPRIGAFSTSFSEADQTWRKLGKDDLSGGSPVAADAYRSRRSRTASSPSRFDDIVNMLVEQEVQSQNCAIDPDSYEETFSGEMRSSRESQSRDERYLPYEQRVLNELDKLHGDQEQAMYDLRREEDELKKRRQQEEAAQRQKMEEDELKKLLAEASEMKSVLKKDLQEQKSLLLHDMPNQNAEGKSARKSKSEPPPKPKPRRQKRDLEAEGETAAEAQARLREAARLAEEALSSGKRLAAAADAQAAATAALQEAEQKRQRAVQAEAEAARRRAEEEQEAARKQERRRQELKARQAAEELEARQAAEEAARWAEEQKPKAEALLVERSVPLEVVFTGGPVDVPITRTRSCPVCIGAGFTARPVPCPMCLGAGTTMCLIQVGDGVEERPVQCHVCDGQGAVLPSGGHCLSCSSKQVVEEDVLVRFELPPGVVVGERITAVGVGHAPLGCRAGDVVLVCGPPPELSSSDATFVREGANLLADRRVSLQVALCGGTLELPFLGGTSILVTLPRGEVIAPGSVKCVPGEGLPHRDSPHMRGDLLLRFHVDFPTRLPEEAVACIDAALSMPECQASEAPLGNQRSSRRSWDGFE